jgi:hypothetical protein
VTVSTTPKPSSSDGERQKARRFVAVTARDFTERCLFLEMLGLGPTVEEIAAHRQEHANDSVIEDGDERT